MAQAQKYKREANGIRLDIQGGMNTVLSPDLLPPGTFAFLQNVRRYLQGRTVARAPLGANLLPSAIASGPTSLLRLNDQTPAGPGSGFALIEGAAGTMYLNSTAIATGLTGLPLSFVTNRPNASPQPWAYTADGAVGGVTLTTINAETGSPASYTGNGMNKVRSDGTIWHTGIAEPQVAPTVTFPGGGTGITQVFYRYIYRSSPTGAPSNPSPESIAGTNAQASPSATQIAASGGVINPDISVNATQYEGNATQIRTKGGVSPGTVTDYIIARGFGFALPTNVNVDGVQIDLNWVGQNAGTGVLTGVQLFYLGAPLGSVKLPGIPNQSFSTDTLQGSNGDTWGTTLTPAIINDPTFGFGVQITTASVGGSDRSFVNSMAVTVFYSTQDAIITPTPSSDPQVDKIDVYRMGGALTNFTFVGTTDNSSTPFLDTLADLAAVNNPQLEFDNFEPFPSIDLPRRGTVNVAAGAIAGTMTVTWVSGHLFNQRWLPGTVMIIGSPSGIAYTFYNRPSATTVLTVILDPSMMVPSPSTGLTYEIQEPDLAAEPSPVIWGPTPDNGGAFYFGLDPINEGDLLWSKGNNFDAAPDTNRLGVTSGSEILMNGVITSELSVVFSTERFWLIYPNFADALAALGGTGVIGTQWTLIQSAATRGLYMRYAIGALGALIAWRAKDCVCISMGGGPEQSITDSIYNLFPHEGFSPVAINIGGNVVSPPDDTRPNAQTITVAPGYIFYNYQDATATPRTLVYDIEGKGWSVDFYNPKVNAHLWAVGQVDQLLAGCIDGTVRQLITGGAETGTAVIVTRSENGGDDRAFKRIGDIFVKALAVFGHAITVGLFKSRITVPVTGFTPTSLTGFGTIEPYVIDFSSGFGKNIDDIAATFSWGLGSGNILDLWQPDWVPLPEDTQDRPTDWGDAGTPGNKLFRGLLMEMDTLGNAKAFSVERAEDATLFTPNESPVTVSDQTLKAFTFTPPFVSHSVRTVSTDGVPWRVWGQQWIVDPWVEYATLDSAWSNLEFQGAKYIRGLVLPMDTQGLSAQFKVVTSDGDNVTFTATTPSAVKTVVSFAFVPPIVAHDVQIQSLTATAGAWVEEARWDFDKYPEIIPEYTPIMEVNDSGAKLVRGLNITGDTANVSTSFVISYDGGQTGPTVTAAFNGKQTKAFAFTPFIAHDIQLIPQARARIFLDTSKWDMDPWPEYTALYSSWMNLGNNGAKYIRGLVLPMDTDGQAAVVNIVTSDGQTIALPSTTTPSGVKTQVAFAFDPPFVAHELRFVPQSEAGLWAAEARFDFDQYPEIIQEYTPIMEISGPDNKFVQGLKLIGDTANQAVTFHVLYDGGQTGPTFTGTFNGKQTRIFSWVPFLAHDIQLVPQANARIWWGGIGDGISEWVFQPFAESASNWTTELTALGGVGWQHLRYLNIEYISTTAITITFTVDTGNGSIAPNTITIPSSGGTQTKFFTQVSDNKWKLLSMSATSSAAFNLMADGCEVWVRSWGVDTGKYRRATPFGGPMSPEATV